MIWVWMAIILAATALALTDGFEKANLHLIWWLAIFPFGYFYAMQRTQIVIYPESIAYRGPLQGWSQVDFSAIRGVEVVRHFHNAVQLIIRRRGESPMVMWIGGIPPDEWTLVLNSIEDKLPGLIPRKAQGRYKGKLTANRKEIAASGFALLALLSVIELLHVLIKVMRGGWTMIEGAMVVTTLIIAFLALIMFKLLKSSPTP